MVEEAVAFFERIGVRSACIYKKRTKIGLLVRDSAEEKGMGSESAVVAQAEIDGDAIFTEIGRRHPGLTVRSNVDGLQRFPKMLRKMTFRFFTHMLRFVFPIGGRIVYLPPDFFHLGHGGVGSDAVDVVRCAL